MKWKYPDEWSLATLKLIFGVVLLGSSAFSLHVWLTGGAEELTWYRLISRTVFVLLGTWWVVDWFLWRRRNGSDGRGDS